MLAGDDTQAKPDRHVLRFLNAVSGETVSVQQAYELLTDVVKYLKPVYPHLTVRLLDYTIWNYICLLYTSLSIHQPHFGSFPLMRRGKLPK